LRRYPEGNQDALRLGLGVGIVGDRLRRLREDYAGVFEGPREFDHWLLADLALGEALDHEIEGLLEIDDGIRGSDSGRLVGAEGVLERPEVETLAARRQPGDDIDEI